MKFQEVTENLNERQYCNGCHQLLSGPTYICTVCIKYKLHERCANLAYKIQHPSHSSHPLYLQPAYRTWSYKACDECRDFCLGFIFVCEECDFKLDVKCAITAGIGVSQLKEKEEERVTEFHHSTHPHNLILANSSNPIDEIECKICPVPILGPAYFCPRPNCFDYYIIHESCLGIAQKMQVPSHMDHMLAYSIGDEGPQWCSACVLLIYGLAYICEEGCGVEQVLSYLDPHARMEPLSSTIVFYDVVLPTVAGMEFEVPDRKMLHSIRLVTEDKK
ncbi:hypothetical protein DITRI_Ditri20bG0034000 [Diplodiscus trichospermus]